MSKWQAFSLAMAAIIGGYLLTTSTSIIIAAVLPMPQAEAVVVGIMLSFVIWLLSTIYLFYRRQASFGWFFTLGLSAIFYAIFRLFL
jgi:hypothetical protein